MKFSMPRTHFDVIVIGAGPAGSAATILLARAGWSVALIEKQAFPRRKVCGECVAASNLPLLRTLGLGDAVAALAGPDLRQVTLLRGEQRVSAALPAAATRQSEWGMALGRETLDRLLLNQAREAGAFVMQPCTAQAITGGAGAWVCEVHDAQAARVHGLHAPLLIDAHGSWTALHGQQYKPERQRSNGDLFGFKANFEHTALQLEAIQVLALNGGYGGMVVAGGGRATVACCIRRERLTQLRNESPGLAAGDVVEGWLRRECAGVREALSGAQRKGPWLSSGPLQPGVRVHLRDGVLRIGNAAGEAHPILGEGMSMALQSAALLCAHLLADGAAARGSDALFQAAMQRRYAQAWQAAFRPRLRLAAAFAHAAMRPLPGALLMATLRAWPGLLTRGARWGGKVRPGPAGSADAPAAISPISPISPASPAPPPLSTRQDLAGLSSLQSTP